MEFDAKVLVANNAVIPAILSAPLNEEYDALLIAGLLEKIVKGGGLDVRSPLVAAIGKRAQEGLQLPHHGGRVEFFRVLDWIDDNK